MIFSIPCQVLCIGASGSGKTSLVRSIIENSHFYFKEPIDKIIWCYGVENDGIPKGPNIVKCEGLPDLEMLKEAKDGNNILVLDDLQFLINSCAKNRQLLNNLFCLYAHHYNFALFTLCHNIFDVSRSARLSATHYLIFNTNNERIQISNLLRQIFKPEQCKSVLSCYEDAMKKPYQHILINNSHFCDPKLRIMSQIDRKEPIVYAVRDIS